MNTHKALVNRFAKACYRFEAIQEDLDILLFDTDDEIKANEYEDLADQAAEIVLKLSANGNNVGMHFYNYYLCRLEYIIAYFRELLDDEETPLAEDEENAAVEEDDNENDAQTAESDEAADDPAASAPISETDILLSLVEPMTASARRRLKELSPKVHDEVRETLAMWDEMNDVVSRKSGGGDSAEAVKELDDAEGWYSHVLICIREGLPKTLVSSERGLRERINMAIDAIPGFRDSEEFKELIERCSTYKEKEQ